MTCIAEQAKGQMYRSRVDLHGLLGAQFENVNKTMPHALARLESKVSLVLSLHYGLMPRMLCIHVLLLHSTHCAVHDVVTADAS